MIKNSFVVMLWGYRVNGKDMRGHRKSNITVVHLDAVKATSPLENILLREAATFTWKNHHAEIFRWNSS